jgi:DNA-binding transcriptional LysR family regulator
VREIEATLERFEDNLCGLRGLSAGSLRIAAATTEKYIVPRLLAEFVRRHPEIEPLVQVLPCEALLARLADGADDLYFLSLPPGREGIVMQPVLPNPFVVLARSDHPLAGARSTPFARFAQEPLIVREPGSGTRAVTKRIFAAHGLERSRGGDVRRDRRDGEHGLLEALQLGALGLGENPHHQLHA